MGDYLTAGPCVQDASREWSTSSYTFLSHKILSYPQIDFDNQYNSDKNSKNNKSCLQSTDNPVFQYSGGQDPGTYKYIKGRVSLNLFILS